MIIIGLTLLLAVAPPPPGKPAADQRCTTFLTGKWTAKGQVTGFGRPVKVDNAYSYDADGTFRSRTRFLGQDGGWHEQTLDGRWRAATGSARGECVLTLEGSGVSAGSSSTSPLTMVDRDTFRSLGVDAKRVK